MKAAVECERGAVGVAAAAAAAAPAPPPPPAWKGGAERLVRPSWLSRFLAVFVPPSMQLAQVIEHGAVPEMVLFLDVDGVLHRADYCSRMFRAAAMKRLRAIVDGTGAELVLSSNWRREPIGIGRVSSELQRYAMSLRSATVDAGSADPAMRVLEIAQWLKDHPAVRHWLILDDLDLAAACPPGFEAVLHGHFVRTKTTEGLSDADVERCLKLTRRSRDKRAADGGGGGALDASRGGEHIPLSG